MLNLNTISNTEVAYIVFNLLNYWWEIAYAFELLVNLLLMDTNMLYMYLLNLALKTVLKLKTWMAQIP